MELYNVFITFLGLLRVPHMMVIGKMERSTAEECFIIQMAQYMMVSITVVNISSCNFPCWAAISKTCCSELCDIFLRHSICVFHIGQLLECLLASQVHFTTGTHNHTHAHTHTCAHMHTYTCTYTHA